MKLDLPGGWTIEFAGTSNGNPPDRQGGMATNVPCQWMRLRWRTAIDTGWVRTANMAISRALEWWRLVETPQDMIDAWDITAEVPATSALREVVKSWPT